MQPFAARGQLHFKTNRVSLLALSRGSVVEFYLMCHYSYPRIIQVKPGRNLPVGDDEDVPYPRRVSLYRSQGVPQLFVVLKAAGRNIFILLGLQKEKNLFLDFKQNTKVLIQLGKDSELWHMGA